MNYGLETESLGHLMSGPGHSVRLKSCRTRFPNEAGRAVTPIELKRVNVERLAGLLRTERDEKRREALKAALERETGRPLSAYPNRDSARG